MILTCNICDFKCCGNQSLEDHMNEKHRICEIESDTGLAKANIELNLECENCNLTYQTEDKLEKHLCRVTVKNPSFCDYYIKNWIIINRCTPVFHRILKSEVALLHCQDCAQNKKRCVDKFPMWLPAQEDRDGGIWHLELIKFLKDGRIDWQALKSLIKTDMGH